MYGPAREGDCVWKPTANGIETGEGRRDRINRREGRGRCRVGCPEVSSNGQVREYGLVGREAGRRVCQAHVQVIARGTCKGPEARDVESCDGRKYLFASPF